MVPLPSAFPGLFPMPFTQQIQQPALLACCCFYLQGLSFVEASSPTWDCQQEMLLQGIVKPHSFRMYNLKNDSYC